MAQQVLLQAQVTIAYIIEPAMSIISFWMKNKLISINEVVESVTRDSPKIVMFQEAPYLTNQEIHELIINRLTGNYSLYRKEPSELNLVRDHLADNFMLVHSDIRVVKFYDESSQEWMQKSSINMFGISVEIGSAEPHNRFKYRIPVFSVLAHQPINDLDALENTYWIQKMLSHADLNPQSMIMMGHFYDESFPMILERILGVRPIISKNVQRRRSRRNRPGLALD